MVIAHANSALAIALAKPDDRLAIYRLRHDVYAVELGQHAMQPNQQLRDPLDAENEYIIATCGDAIIGCVSITLPQAKRFSLEKYLDRSELPLQRDQTVFEVRLLTVARSHRSSGIALLLMHAAARYVEEHCGRAIIGMGRREVMSLYQSSGFQPTGQRIRSGHVEFEVMTAYLSDVQAQRQRRPILMQRLQHQASWNLPFPFNRQNACYHGGAFFTAVGERFDSLDSHARIINADVLDAWFPPAPAVIEAMHSDTSWLMRTSPPTRCDGLIQILSEVRRAPAECLVIGAGSSDLIFRALRHWLTPASRVLILDPMYGEYAHVLEHVVGCNVDRFMLQRDEHFRIDVDRLLHRLRTQRFDFVIMVNPNSPTGQFLCSTELQYLLRQAPARTRFWIDETYIEYAGEANSFERFATTTDNVIICKSMSKVYALSGMRIAYLCGPVALIDAIRHITPPWVVGLPSQLAAVRALESPEYYKARYRQTHELRARLAHALQQSGMDILDGVANFLLCWLPSDGPDAAQVVAACRARNLFIRDASTMGQSLGHHALRIAVKDHATNVQMIKIVREVLNGNQSAPSVDSTMAAATV